MGALNNHIVRLVKRKHRHHVMSRLYWSASVSLGFLFEDFSFLFVRCIYYTEYRAKVFSLTRKVPNSVNVTMCKISRN